MEKSKSTSQTDAGETNPASPRSAVALKIASVCYSAPLVLLLLPIELNAVDWALPYTIFAALMIGVIGLFRVRRLALFMLLSPLLALLALFIGPFIYCLWHYDIEAAPGAIIISIAAIPSFITIFSVFLATVSGLVLVTALNNGHR